MTGFRGSLVVSASIVSLLLLSAVHGAGAATADTFTCTDCPITINDNTSVTEDRAATPYPSQLGVLFPPEGVPAVDKVTVTLTGLTHGALDNVDVLLVKAFGGPSAPAVELMSDVGGPSPVSGLNLTFDDAASSTLPQNSPPASGTYKPTNYAGGGLPCVADDPVALPSSDPFPTPAPAPPMGGYSQTLSTFHGTPFSGFDLYVGDDCAGGVGLVTSWSFNVTYVPTAATVVGFSTAYGRRGVALRWRTATELGILGFNLFRTGPGKTVKLSRALIHARASDATRGASYRFLDHSANRGLPYVYRLQLVKQSGVREWAGISVTGLRP